jgi:hypothetical protein
MFKKLNLRVEPGQYGRFKIQRLKGQAWIDLKCFDFSTREVAQDFLDRILAHYKVKA